ncbi:pilus (MSHA type) biogenesis protein MshL [Sulfurimonas paralvinellae]|uniref:Pilus (MSHA type) biogenesis protein MshL n=1 Tax=Sulfurimonas paralvinellae TaxID=317658 RepID=A0A7M1B9C3_9BACT|nr:pilus (MSHA type) biogenesis protein MshL [Sulfurimonas paralvinellae]QOP45418.1 pilus (MSHA type) biogenesis protein MshL [Sulfurimonas paralvinellae]
MKFIKTSLCAAILTTMVSTSSFADCTYELFSISSAKNTKILDFIDQLSDECGFSIIITDPYAEKFLQTKLNKTNLKNLTIDEVLNIILTENNLSYTLENNLLKISYLETKVFNIDYILSQRKSTGSTDVTLSSSNNGGQQNGAAAGATAGGTTGGAAGNGTNATADTGIKIESTDEVKFWEQLESEFQSVLNRPTDKYVAPEPLINKNAGLITVTATEQQLKRFDKYLKKLQDKVQLQVLIDVQLLAVTMNEGKTTGIDWKQLYALQNVKFGINTLKLRNVSEFDTTDPLNPQITKATIPGAAGIAKIATIQGGGSLNEVIKFLKTQGDVNALSNPKVLTLNNQPALITAGTEYFYKIKSSTNQQGTGGGVAATTQDEAVQSVFAGVLLTITPEISDDKTITLKINPSLSETTTNLAGTDNSGRDMPPDLTRRQLSSVVTVKDGNRIILGGLINTKNTNKSNKVPILGDIPILSYLFKYEEKVKSTQELVIIIEPHIIHKSKNSVSLSDLGYEGLSNDLLELESASKGVKKTQNADENTSADDK